MSCREAENICTFLRSKDIELSSNSVWLSSCIEWYNSHMELRNLYGSLEEYVCIQWLLADLQDVQHACLPDNCKDRVLHLNSKYSVQINWMRDIGRSCYSQLPTVKRLDDPESNFFEGEQKKPKWEPSEKRVLMLEVTDGVNTLKAMEYSPIPKLTEPFLPGTKVVLSGPIECRNGILLLKNDNVTLLGGEVEQLYKKNSIGSLLSRCLNIEQGSEDPIRRTTSNTIQTRPQNSNIQSTPNSALITNGDTSALDTSNYMLDEDDQFLCELPDNVLNCPDDNNGFNSLDSSPVLDQRTVGRQITTQMQSFGTEPKQNSIRGCTTTNLQSKPLEIKKPKLFPSLEDLRPVGRDTSVSIDVVTAPSSSLTKSNTIADNSLNNSFGSSLNNSVVNRTRNFDSFNSLNNEHSNRNTSNNEISVNICSDNSMDYTFNNHTKYPLTKKVEIKVNSITKLKIRSGEWFCCGSVVMDNKPLDVTFNNKVLESLFGIPAAEVEIWRGEMSTNPSLKKKVNDILKVGQTKLKILNCPMSLEYSSDDCTPQVIAIHIS